MNENDLEKQIAAQFGATEPSSRDKLQIQEERTWDQLDHQRSRFSTVRKTLLIGTLIVVGGSGLTFGAAAVFPKHKDCDVIDTVHNWLRDVHEFFFGPVSAMNVPPDPPAPAEK